MYFCWIRRNTIKLCPKCIFVVTLLNESHWVIICIIRIFGQICGQNFGIWPPGVPIYMGISYWFAIYFEEIPPSLVLNVFLWLLCIIKWSKFWYLTPWGAYISYLYIYISVPPAVLPFTSRQALSIMYFVVFVYYTMA